MYENVGKKIKGLAKTIFIIEAIIVVITGIVFMYLHGFFEGLLEIVVGSLLAWVSTWILYGFGELVDKVCDIERNTRVEVQIDTQGYFSGMSNSTLIHNKPQTQATMSVQTNREDINKENLPVSAEIRNGEKVCPKCGQSQRSDRSVCWSCGQHFDN